MRLRRSARAEDLAEGALAAVALGAGAGAGALAAGLTGGFAADFAAGFSALAGEEGLDLGDFTGATDLGAGLAAREGGFFAARGAGLGAGLAAGFLTED